MATQTSNTGESDPNSVNNSGLVMTAKEWLGLAGDVRNLIDPADPKTTITTAPAATTDLTKYLPYIGGGLVLLVVMMFAMRK